jgi:predicted short-subunit dehydrogenase-like oxidoreductase (DUF2520 family)
MLPAMAKKPDIAIVGPGRLGTALALQLKRAGFTVAAIIPRHKASSRKKAQTLAGKIGDKLSPASLPRLVWFCVPDRQIAAAARDLSASGWKGRVAFHASGALASDELNVLRARGTAVASVHPLMTFVKGSIPSLHGVPFAVEGDKKAVLLAKQVVSALGGEPFLLKKKHKAAYHAWGAFASPLLVSLLVSAERVAHAAGLSAKDARRKMLPILCQTIANYAELGPAGAFSGPIVRGDAATIRKHLRALSRIPDARAVYLALARLALLHLPTASRRELKKLLR